MENSLVTTQNRKPTTSSGFSLIELLVVVFILGILSSIAVVSITGALRSANVKACETDYATVDNAIQGYQSDNPGTLPSVLSLYLENPASSPSPSPTASEMAAGSLSKLGYMTKLTLNNSYYLVLKSNSSSTYSIEVWKKGGSSALGTDVSVCKNL